MLFTFKNKQYTDQHRLLYAFWTDLENYRRISDLVKKCLYGLFYYGVLRTNGLSTNEYTQKQYFPMLKYDFGNIS